MAIKSKAGIYQILEDLLRKTGETPLTCVDLFESPKVRLHATDANKVSDYLGHMWRRGLLQRWYASKDDTAKARYAYTWLAKNDAKVPPTRIGPANKPQVVVTENNDSVTLDFSEFTITIQRKT